ncbi:hypothetical protein [Delftia sp.]|uniref:hypothetical protein n=1 Tax=Delftia sp. TaxID=1886637 RepID=UPI00259C926F|nr:hypothetical protein [Delftia sp.]
MLDSVCSDGSTEGPIMHSQICEARKTSGAWTPLYAGAAPAAVSPRGEYPHEQMDAMALDRYKVVPSNASMLWSHAVVAGDGTQQLYVGREVECQNMVRKFAGHPWMAPLHSTRQLPLPPPRQRPPWKRLQLPVPAGFALVPIEPTQQMLDAGRWSGAGSVSIQEEWARKEMWSRMLATITPPPAAYTDDLVALVENLAQALSAAAPDNDLAGHALNYLKRNGLQESPLRAAEAAPGAPAAPSADYACMYQNLADAMGYDSGKDGIEWSPEEWAAHLLAAYQAAPAAPALSAAPIPVMPRAITGVLASMTAARSPPTASWSHSDRRMTRATPCPSCPQASAQRQHLQLATGSRPKKWTAWCAIWTWPCTVKPMRLPRPRCAISWALPRLRGQAGPPGAGSTCCALRGHAIPSSPAEGLQMPAG